MAKVLRIGAFAYLFNSVSVFSVFLYPYRIRYDLIWTIIMLFAFAWLSYGISVSIIDHTDQIYQDQINQRLIPDERSRTEVNLPTLIQFSLSRKKYGILMYYVVVFCCIFTVVAMSLMSTGSAQRILREWYACVYLFVIMICISIMNNRPFWDLQYIHIATMICRLLYCILRIFVKLDPDHDLDASWLLVPCLVTVFFYQLSLPRVLAAFEQTQEEHITMQKYVLIFTLFANIILICGLHANLSTDRGEGWEKSTKYLYLASKLSAPQIYWHALSRIITASHYKINLARARHWQWTFGSMMQTFLHFPVYTAAMIFLYFEVDLFKHSLTYLISMPLIAGVTYCSLSFSHHYYLKELNKEVDWWIWVLMGACVALFVYGIYNLFQIDFNGANGEIQAIFTVFVIVVGMYVWKRVVNFFE